MYVIEKTLYSYDQVIVRSYYMGDEGFAPMHLAQKFEVANPLVLHQSLAECGEYKRYQKVLPDGRTVHEHMIATGGRATYKYVQLSDNYE